MYRSLNRAQREGQAWEVRRILASSPAKRDELVERHIGVSPGTPCYQLEEDGYLPPSAIEKRERLLDWYFFKRFRSPRWVAVEKEKKGDLEAHNQITRATDEFWLLLNGHGPVPAFKADQVHSDLLELGLHNGLDKLSVEELANCFEELCPCGKEHSGDALTKQRGRIEEHIAEAARLKAEYGLQRPSQQRFAVYGAWGYVAKPYSWRDGTRFVEVAREGHGLEYVVYHDGSISGFKEEESHISRLQNLGRLPAAFGVQTIEQIFGMFFLE